MSWTPPKPEMGRSLERAIGAIRELRIAIQTRLDDVGLASWSPAHRGKMREREVELLVIERKLMEDR